MMCPYGKYEFDHTCQYCNEALGGLCSDCNDPGFCTDCVWGFYPNQTDVNGSCVSCNETLGELCVDCSDDKTCTECQDGFYPHDGYCSNCNE